MGPVELVSPAGSFETLETALAFGADAVYLGPRAWSLRAGADDFSGQGLARAVNTVKARGKRVYLTLNSILNNKDLAPLRRFIDSLHTLSIDGIIISDPALLAMLRETPFPAHLSTQTSVMNRETAAFWKAQGVKRIVLARELSLPEIGEICHNVDMEFEVFAHGAMCVSISGRCLLSDYLSLRHGNKGECAHVCRWGLSVHGDKSKGIWEVEEEGDKTFFLNSRDLCTITFLDELVKTGVRAVKIEGRNKGAHYSAVVTRIYREALDALEREGANYRFREQWLKELEGVSNRTYTSGFYKELQYDSGFASIHKGRQNYEAQGFIQEMTLVGVVRETLSRNRAVVDIRNEFHIRTRVSLFSPEKGSYLEDSRVLAMESISSTPETQVHPNRVVIMEFEDKAAPGSLVRVKAGA